jgi:hypothetical protein
VVFALLGIPAGLIGAAALAAVVCTRCSSLRITSAGVEIRNYPQSPKLILLTRVERFEATTPVGNFSSLRPETGVLVLTDGSRLPVRKLSAPEAGTGIDALNNRVDSLRHGG